MKLFGEKETSNLPENSGKKEKTKRYKVIMTISILVGVFMICGAYAATRLKKNANTAYPVNNKNATEEKPVLFNSVLDNLGYSKEMAERHPLAVSVENHPDARPQSGLSSASIVYEAITEGGITRFLAIFGPSDAKEIGPIRSARLFFMDYLKEYDAYFAHAGGNEDALANMTKYAIKDLNHAAKYYYRDNKGKNVASEHTLYSSTEKLYSYAKSKGYNQPIGNIESLKFKKTETPSETPKGAEIDFSGNNLYKVKWEYDASKNQYLRYLAGTPHLDRNTNEQISSKNIIIQVVSRKLDPTGSYGGQNWVFDNIGSGKAYIMRDGEIINATWKKSSLSSRTKFFDNAGSEIEFNSGHFWYEIIPPEMSPSFM